VVELNCGPGPMGAQALPSPQDPRRQG
jgi:hypothetical protein